MRPLLGRLERLEREEAARPVVEPGDLGEAVGAVHVRPDPLCQARGKLQRPPVPENLADPGAVGVEDRIPGAGNAV